MHVKELAANGLRREFQVTVDVATIDEKMNARLGQLSQNVKMPGFRPGKVPAHIVKQRYGQQARAEVAEQLLQEGSRKAVTERNLRLALQPSISDVVYEDGKPLEFKVTAELFPEIPDVDFSKITVEKLTFDVAEKDVDEGIQRLAERNKRTKKVEKARASKEGDVVVIDFLGKVDGVPFDGGKAEKFSLELGSNQFIPGFEDQVTGMKPGDEKVISVKFPESYHSESLKGKAATFDITLHEVHERELPEINDEFAKNFGFESLANLKEKVKEQIASDYSSLVRTRLKKLLFDELEGKLSFDLPQSMVDQEFNLIWQKIEQAKAEGGDEALDKPEAELRAEYRGVAERRVKLGLFLADVSGKNNISVTQDELRKAVMDQARMFPGQEQKVFEFYKKNPAQIQELQGPLLEEKAVDYVLEKIGYTERKVSLEDLMSIDAGGDMEEDKPKAKKAAATKPKKAAEKKDGDLFE